MKTDKEIKDAISGLTVAYDIANAQEWYKKINDYIEALKWVIGE